ncbi:HAD family hydrolase [Rathayibacter toxicus]|uniref:HAD family hydrolase n=1 Tax=Rathayibacter toxicus TaxID=145458 RepID=UPI003B96B916
MAFDLDDTLAASKSPVDPAMADLLVRLLRATEVCIISGGQIGQFRMQVLDRLDGATPKVLAALHLMPTCGTQYYRYRNGDWAQVYAENSTDDEKSRALVAVEEKAQEFGYWESETWGPILEDRDSQITFSALGQAAPVEAKQAWDPTGGGWSIRVIGALPIGLGIPRASGDGPDATLILTRKLIGIPRASGDGPANSGSGAMGVLYSPRKRGWSSR